MKSLVFHLNASFGQILCKKMGVYVHFLLLAVGGAVFLPVRRPTTTAAAEGALREMALHPCFHLIRRFRLFGEPIDPRLSPAPPGYPMPTSSVVTRHFGFSASSASGPPQEIIWKTCWIISDRRRQKWAQHAGGSCVHNIICGRSFVKDETIETEEEAHWSRCRQSLHT